MYLAKQSTVLGLDLQGRGSLRRFLSGREGCGWCLGVAGEVGSGKGLELERLAEEELLPAGGAESVGSGCWAGCSVQGMMETWVCIVRAWVYKYAGVLPRA